MNISEAQLEGGGTKTRSSLRTGSGSSRPGPAWPGFSTMQAWQVCAGLWPCTRGPEGAQAFEHGPKRRWRHPAVRRRLQTGNIQSGTINTKASVQEDWREQVAGKRRPGRREVRERGGRWQEN